VPNLTKKEYADYKLTSDKWEILGLIKEVLQDNFARLAKFEKIAHAIQKGLEKIQKWYNKTDDSNMYFICLGLEPSIKLEYCKAKWDNDDYDKGLASFKKV
ncbi:hypothetical protein DXG01_016106, partial [Tephrocybe rancida]